MKTQALKTSLPKTIIAPSLLACDFSRLADEIRKVEEAGADWLHVDVMDGHFVPNLTVGPSIVASIRRVSHIPVDVHLMIDHPEQHLKQFLDAGAHYITVHVEAPGMQSEGALSKTLEGIKRAGTKAGLSLRPPTPAESLKPFLALLELILVMTVEPGFGGQEFMPEVVPKIRQLRSWFLGNIAVDGGIKPQSSQLCREAGANVLVSGTYVFRSTSYQSAIKSLRGS